MASRKQQMAGAGAPQVDPRTHLPLVDIPNDYLPAFESLRGCIIHWIGPVRKMNSTHRESQRICIIADASLYLVDGTGSIKRCILYKDLQDVLVREQDDAIGFRMAPVSGNDSSMDYDLLLRFGPEHQKVVLSYIQRIYWVHMGRDLPIVELGPADAIDPHLSLIKPQNWTLKIEPLRTKKFLEKLMRDQGAIDQRNDERVALEFIRIKNELKMELETQRNAQYDRMVKQNLKLFSDSQAKDVEIMELKRQLNRLEPFSQMQEKLGGANNGSGGIFADGNRSNMTLRQRRDSIATEMTTGSAGTSVGGVTDPETAQLIVELKKIIEQHPNTDKKRILVAEEKLASTTRLLEKSQLENAPQKEEILLLRKVISAIDSVLRDQSLSLQERVRASLQISGPHAAPEGVATSRLAGPITSDVSSMTEEIQTLRGLLRDAHAIHDEELQLLKDEFHRYDEQMIQVVRDALDTYSPEVGIPNGQAAKKIVADAKQQFLQDPRGELRNQQQSRSPMRGGGGGSGSQSSINMKSSPGRGGGRSLSPLRQAHTTSPHRGGAGGGREPAKNFPQQIRQHYNEVQSMRRVDYAVQEAAELTNRDLQSYLQSAGRQGREGGSSATTSQLGASGQWGQAQAPRISPTRSSPMRGGGNTTSIMDHVATSQSKSGSAVSGFQPQQSPQQQFQLYPQQQGASGRRRGDQYQSGQLANFAW